MLHPGSGVPLRLAAAGGKAARDWQTRAVLEGRDTALELIGARLAALRDGQPFALLVHGEPGSGKSALLDAAVARADGLGVLRARGHEVEAHLPFVALRALIEPLLGLR